MTTITAAVVREQGAPLTLEQLELDDIRDDEVRVKLVATGVCHRERSSATASIRRPCQPCWVTREPGSSRLSARPSRRSVLVITWCSPPRTAPTASSAEPVSWRTAGTSSPRTSVVVARTAPPL
jgi:hypothetical protein